VLLLKQNKISFGFRTISMLRVSAIFLATIELRMEVSMSNVLCFHNPKVPQGVTETVFVLADVKIIRQAIAFNKMALSEVFGLVKTYFWHLWRKMTVQKKNRHLSKDKPVLYPQEEDLLYQSIHRDANFNLVLPQRFFGSFCLVCHK